MRRCEVSRMDADRHARVREFAPKQMRGETEGAADPGETGVKNQIQKSTDGRQPDRAGLPVLALLRRGHGDILGHRNDIQRAAIFGPVAVGAVVIMVMLRPDVRRHATDHAKHKSERIVKPAAAKQAVVAAFVHQYKDAQQEQRHQRDQCRCQPQ